MAAADGASEGENTWGPGGAMASVPEANNDGLRLSFESASGPDLAAPTRHRWPWFAGGAVVILLGVGLAFALGDDPDPASRAEPGEAVDVAVEPFPAVPDPTLPPAPTVPTTPRATPPPLLAEPPLSQSVPSPTDRLVLAAAPREFVIDIAPELVGVNRTEVIALQQDDGLYEVSLPSGRVRVTDLGFFSGRTQMITSDQAVVIWPTPEGAAQFVTTQRSVGLSNARVDRVSWSPATERIYLWASSAFANGYVAGVQLIDGGAPFSANDVDWVDEADNPVKLLDFDGRLLREDTGGVYSVGPDGTDLITTGTVLATGPNHLLLRECDNQRSCRMVSVGRDGERIEWPDDVPDTVIPQAIAGLSPGGDALLVIGRRVSVDVPTSLQILELADATLQPLEELPFFEGFASWDTNGAGVFAADAQLLYFDRFTGEAVVVSEDLPPLRSVRTRRPADTPICEVLELALPRFDEMATGGADNTLGAPTADVLDRIVALSPESLLTGATAVTNFVNSFVSPDVEGSQTVANWPDNVTDGLATLGAYAATDCWFAAR